MTGRDLNLARLRTAALLALGALIVALALAACGGSSGSGGSSGDSGGAAAESSSGSGESDVIVKSNDSVSKNAATEITSAFYPTGHDTDEENASGKHVIKPCPLVSVHQAEGILGGGVSRTEGMQGPTCIFTGSGREISLSLQEVSLAKLRKGARKTTKVNVAGRPGWCLRYEKTEVAVAAGHNQVLVVTGPCQAGVRFAADALAML